MNFLVDFILLAIIIFFTVAGFRKGFIKTFLSGVKNVVAFIVASAFSSKLGAWLKEQFFMEKAKEAIRKKVAEFIGSESATNTDVSNLVKSEHSDFLSFINKMGVDTETIMDMASEHEGAMADSVSEYIAEPCVSALSTVLSFIILFIGTLLVLLIVGALLNLIVKLPVLKGANKFFGGVLGVVIGIFWAFILTALIRIVVPYFSDNAIISSLSHGGPLYGFISSLAPTFLSALIK